MSAGGQRSGSGRAGAGFHQPLRSYVEARLDELGSLDEERCAQLDALAAYVGTHAGASATDATKLVFICTHNSRRSHLAQIWAATAARWFGVAGVATFSGGTEATRFEPRAVAALARAGFTVENVEGPVVHVDDGSGAAGHACFSKRYDDAVNPDAGFAAIMVCDEAAEACPIVSGADARFALSYVDPKHADGTPDESAAYDACCQRIAQEMLYVFSRV